MSIIQTARSALTRVNVRVAAMWCRAGQTVVDAAGVARIERVEHKITIHVQAASASDLQLLPSLPRQSDYRIVYVQDLADASMVSPGGGRDVLRFFGADWSVVQVLEHWDRDQWCRLLVVRLPGGEEGRTRPAGVLDRSYSGAPASRTNGVWPG